MPGVVKRQTRSSKIVPATSKRGASIINSFNRVGKPQTTTSAKIINDKPAVFAPARKAESINITIVCSKKRKAVVDDHDDDDDKEEENAPAPTATRRNLKGTVEPTTPAKRTCRRQPSIAPSSQQRLPPPSPAAATKSDEDAVLCGAQPLLDRLQLQASPSLNPNDGDDALPKQITDLIGLHASFSKALALHHVHNGTNVPIDCRSLCPSITLSWGKRKVVVDDLRLCIGVLNARPSTGVKSPHHLTDYGRGKICVELRPEAAGMADEAKLKRAFESNIRALWCRKQGSASAADLKRFLAGLPLAPVTVCESLMRSAAVLGKGQRTLEEFRHGIVLKKQKEAQRKAQAAAPPLADGSKMMSLIDRIRYKEMLQSQEGGAGAAKPEDLQRRAALQRAGDVADVISMLSTATALGQKRLAFTMPALLTKLKDSLRVPVSREEGASCVKLLAAEIAPQWIKVVTIGARENVVVLPDFAPGKVGIEARVNALLSA